MAEPVDITLFVMSTGRRVRYQTATHDPMAYDVTETLAAGAEPGDRIIRDNVERDIVRAELGIIELGMTARLFNKLWRILKLDKAPIAPGPHRHIEYRHDHPEHGKRSRFGLPKFFG